MKLFTPSDKTIAIIKGYHHKRNQIESWVAYYITKISISINKVGDCSQRQLEGSIFNSYYTEV